MELKIKKAGREFRAKLWHCPKSERVLIIGSAMGVSSRFYSAVADYFYQSSYSVITFDYFSMFHSKTDKTLSKVRLRDWGYKDINMIIDYALNNFPGQDIFFLGHSIAGQLLPLAKKSKKIKAAFLVASQNASKNYWSGSSKLKVNLFWHFTVPVFARTFGYIPGFAYGGKHALNKEIALDWAKWGKNHMGLLGVHPKSGSKYRNFNPPVKFLSFSDDHMLAPYHAVEQLYQSYGSPYKYHEHLCPQQVGLTHIGHFKFFRAECAFLWPKVGAWFNLICEN